MIENQKIRPSQVVGPLGEPLTLDGLPPPSTTRWVVRRKAEVVAAVNGGLLGLFLAVAIVVLAMRSILQTHGTLRLALATALLVWVITAMVATVEESRTTWLLLALIALAGRLALEQPERLAACFPDSDPAVTSSEVPAPAV